MGQYRSTHTGPQIDAGVDAALNPNTVPEADSDALITSDAVAKVQQGFAPIETGATAANAYAIGDLLVWGGVLYKAKTAIAVSDSFTVGTNIETTTVADKLNNIDTEITPDTDTTINGLLKGNGSKVAQAVGDTDYATPAAVTATRQMLAPILADPAGQAVSAGDYFIYNGNLYKALQAITSAMTAATFTGATYSEVVSAGGLNDLKSALTQITEYSGSSINVPSLGACFTKGGFMFIRFYDFYPTAASGVLGTIPAGLRPPAPVYGIISTTDTSSIAFVAIDPTGIVSFSGATPNKYHYGQLCYPIGN